MSTETAPNMQQQASSYQFNNDDFITPSVLALRLDTERDARKFELFLRGKELKTIQDPNDQTKSSVVEIFIGEPLCNEDGIRYIKSFFEGLVNPANVQGNYTRIEYYMHLEDVHVRLTKMLTGNNLRWEITPSNRRVILTKFITQVRVFLTRPIDNKERDSFGNIKHIESKRLDTEQAQKSGWFGK